jgi:adenylate cyclase
MRKLLFILLFTTLSIPTFSQNKGQELIDSLVNNLTKIKDDTNKIKRILKIAYLYTSVNADSSVRYSHKALSKSREINWLTGEVKSLGSISYGYIVQGQYSKSIEAGFEALNKSEKLKNDKLKSSIYSYLGLAYLNLKDFKKAKFYTNNCIEIDLRLKDDAALASDYNTLGLICQQLDDKKAALEAYSLAITKAKIVEDLSIIAYSSSNSATIYLENKEYRKALHFHFYALNIEEELGDINGLATEYGSISNVYRELSQVEIQKSMKKKFLDSSIYYGLKSVEFCQKSKNFADMILIKNSLSKNYVLKNDFKNAYKYYSEATSLKDTLFSIENASKLREIEEKQLTRLHEAILSKEKVVRNFSIGGFAIMLLFAGVFFFQRNKISKEKKRSEELLLNILPEEVAEELKEKGYADAKSIESVTILFTDFKGFTQVSEKLTPHELVKEIDHCFRAFDTIITKHNIEKIKTIGDAYMCAGGLPIPNNTHTEDVVCAAIEIRDFIEARKLEKESLGEPFFEIRIGIHTGNIVAGIVGIKKFAYDIWGDAVNIASRMESAGQEGKINISQTTYELIKHKFKCTYRGKIEAKNKGEIDMFFVE